MIKLNIFRIPADNLAGLKSKLAEKELTRIESPRQENWDTVFYFSSQPMPTSIPWIEEFRAILGNDQYGNVSYYGAMLFWNEESAYAVSFGKCHFYIRPYCDYDFGINLAKRIANTENVTQTSAIKFQGTNRKEIKGFTSHTPLSVIPGSSVDFIQGEIIEDKRGQFGKTAKFGTSALLSFNGRHDKIGYLLKQIEKELADKERFKLPRTMHLTEEDEVARYDKLLIQEILDPVGTSSLTSDSYELFGVDFVFASSGNFKIKNGHFKEREVNILTMKEIRNYIKDKGITDSRILETKIIEEREDGVTLTRPLKEAVDFISDEDNVVLKNGRWMKFNQDYIDILNAELDLIGIEATEDEFVHIVAKEEDFNLQLVSSGYDVADKNFDILRVKNGPPIEAWDLKKNDTVYAVKFGTPQKLTYVVDQAYNVSELIHNGANLEPIPDFNKYCLWFGYRGKKIPECITETRSIILKQKVEVWARKCREVGITPVIKFSRKLHPEHDLPEIENLERTGSPVVR